MLYHKYVDSASFYRILPQIQPDPDPDLDPVHPYTLQPQCFSFLLKTTVSHCIRELIVSVTLLISVPGQGVYCFLLLTLSVCPSVCLFVTNIASSFLFLDAVEPFFGREFYMWHSTKLFFLRFLI